MGRIPASASATSSEEGNQRPCTTTSQPVKHGRAVLREPSFPPTCLANACARPAASCCPLTAQCPSSQLSATSCMAPQSSQPPSPHSPGDPPAGCPPPADQGSCTPCSAGGLQEHGWIAPPFSFSNEKKRGPGGEGGGVLLLPALLLGSKGGRETEGHGIACTAGRSIIH